MPSNQNTTKDLTSAQVMVDQKSTFLSDGLADAGVVMADMDRGFTKEVLVEEGRVDADGTNYVGDSYAREGFNGVNSKYKRL
jgi:hypothetical protein